MSTIQIAAPSSSPPSKPPPPQHASPATPRTLRRPGPRKTSAIGRILTASTPNLRGLFVDASKSAPPLPSLQRKASQAALTSTSLAALPDASESYALGTLNSSPSRSNKMVPSPLTPRAGPPVGDDVTVGDTVEVPGNMLGTVRFVGSVGGKKGTFAGVELHHDFASRGKNNGDVDGYASLPTVLYHSLWTSLCLLTCLVPAYPILLRV